MVDVSLQHSGIQKKIRRELELLERKKYNDHCTQVI
jgi:hypothetical protein